MTEKTLEAVVLAKRPDGSITPDVFATVERLWPAIKEGDVLTRTLFASVDPYMRGILNEGRTYREGLAVGDMIPGETVGQVIQSKHPAFREGAVVSGAFGWATVLATPGDRLVRVPDDVPPSTYLGVLGMPGTTAYSGMTDIGQPKAGETVVISAASGPVGATAGQIARRAGARVIGIAGSVEKCAWVTEIAGFDGCINHHENLDEQLDALCPDGVDVYYENVGGTVGQAVIRRLRNHARVPICGLVADYNDRDYSGLAHAPTISAAMLLFRRARIEGFIVGDRPERFAEWRALATPWVQEGSLVYKEQIVKGLDQAPLALVGQLSGQNFGKLLVQVADVPTNHE
ncbi:NADP-dependent oxidoreductase [Komagataeibacter xylinus]|nr:NADP-dependent oxidoreductase [Komagataeibacter xylinus]